MRIVSGIGVTALQVATHPIGMYRLRGNGNNGSTARWLLVFDSRDTPADGAVPTIPAIAVPVKGVILQFFDLGTAQFLQGLYVCLSNTQATKTLATDTMDIDVEVDQVEQTPGTLVGDLTTGVNGLQVWSEATGAAAEKRLCRLEVDGTNLTGGTQYIQLFPMDTVTPSAGQICLKEWPIAAGSTKYLGAGALSFGEMGMEVNAIKTGCTIKISSTPQTYSVANGTARIRAEYHA